MPWNVALFALKVHIIFMWIARECEPLVRRMAQQFPAVLVTGARQVGKTSLLRRLFPGASYLTLDFPGHAEAARTAPDQLLDQYRPPLILDEIQYVPDLLRHVKVRIDRDRSPGQYLLTGSQVFALMQGVSESLAGRCGVLTLHTLSLGELAARENGADEADYLFRGGYPALYGDTEAELWFPSYVATYLERDIRNVLRIGDLQEFHRFMRVCALRNAQVLNYSDLARDAGVSPNTARKWLGLLEASGILALAEPYFGNRTKRLIKAPKLVFLDSGLAAFLAGFRSAGGLFGSPYAGAFWEAYVFGQVFRQGANLGRPVSVHYWRTAGGQEVDLVVELGAGEIWAAECKWKEHPGPGDEGGLRALAAAEKGSLTERFVVCRTEVTYRLPDGTWVVNLPAFLERLRNA